MKAKILVIDDEEGIRFTFRRFLTDNGYDVTTASDFDETLHHISHNDYDVIFTDIILEGKSGIDILKEIKEKDINSPVIMITGYPNIETASSAIRLGAFDYIPKPIQKEALLHTTDVALQYKKLSDEKEKYRINLEAIFNNIKDAIIMLDNQSTVLEVNEAAKNICGFSRDIIGKPFNSLPKRCNGKCLEAIEETIDKKHPVLIQHVECLSDKYPEQIVTITTSPILNPYGKVFSESITLQKVIMVIRDETRLVALERHLGERLQFFKIIGKNAEMQKIYSLIELLSEVQTTVLIAGESGTGKELVAEAIHYRGNRSNKHLVKVNCSALPETLLESELFGHVRGAFTGAIKDKVGRFQKADGGTIFLDEISDISPKTQIGLLRVLQEMEFERIGDSTPIKVDVRVIAATNQDLFEKVRAGKFREDLYYRLKVMELNIPPLKERQEDIPLLIDHFLKKFNKKFNKNILAISENVKKIFMNYPWPGNIRELEHALEHAFILCSQQTITIEHLPPELKTSAGKEILPLRENAKNKQVIIQALEKTGWNKAKAARLLGISRRTIYRKIKEHNITK